MTKEQRLVRDFMLATGYAVAGQPRLESVPFGLFLRMIEEEVDELRLGIRDRDMAETADALCDVVYLCYGLACSMGIDLEPLFLEVHRTNMVKAGGPVREDGKRLKPPGWMPPRIALLLDEQKHGRRG